MTGGNGELGWISGPMEEKAVCMVTVDNNTLCPTVY